MRYLACVGGALILTASAAARQTTLDWPTGQRIGWSADSGIRANAGAAAAVVFHEVIAVPDAAWLRVHFGQTVLEPGSYLTVRSPLDGEIQILDAATLALWSNASAYFNGDRVEVGLVGAARSSANRVTVTALDMGSAFQPMGSQGQCGICGPTDDRQPSGELWTARLLPAGCTASVFTDESCMVTAGHCVGANMVVQFNVPNSSPGCSVNHPPAADQFPVTSVTFEVEGPGNDWAVMTVGDNNVGQRPFERYGQLRELATTPAVIAQSCSLTGYGVDQTCTRSQTQQTASGTICQVLGDQYRFEVDLRGGNSGSALISNDTIIGIATHCPCCNIATRIDVADFSSAREAVCPTLFTALPFFDEVTAFVVDPLKWPFAPGVLGNQRGIAEPSPARSLNFDATNPGGDEARSALMDASGEGALELSYWYEQTGIDDSPEPGDDLVVEYANAAGDWVEINRHLGSGPDMVEYEQVSLSLPPAALHGALRIRFRCISTDDGSDDDWFVDDVCVSAPGACPKPSACPPDLDGDGSVGITDLLELLAAWGDNPGHPADIDGNDTVDITDLLAVLAAWGAVLSARREIRWLDPLRDHQRIALLSARRDFPFDTTRSLELALFRTFCSPAIAGLLDRSGEFARAPQKRYDDTDLIVSELIEWGYDSERGRRALRRMNQIHGRFQIANEDFLSVLSTFIFEPIRWNRRFGWRRMCDAERLASIHFWREVGHRMGIRDIPGDFDALERFNRDYERERFRRTGSAVRVGTATRDMLVSRFPRPLAGLVRAVIHAVLDDPVREAFGFPRAPAIVRAALPVLLRLRGGVLRLLPRRRRPLLRTAMRPRSYRHGYTIERLGPPPWAAAATTHPAEDRR